jgi:hypothetical protein
MCPFCLYTELNWLGSGVLPVRLSLTKPWTLKSRIQISEDLGFRKYIEFWFLWRYL